mgnify:CR=1 FL=1
MCELYEGAQKSDVKSDSIMLMENRFGSVGKGESEIIYMHLYPSRWDLVNHYPGFWQVVISYNKNRIGIAMTFSKICDEEEII